MHTYTETCHVATSLPCVFRSWRADEDDKLRHLHGAELSFDVTFEAWELDDSKAVVNHHVLAGLTEEIQKWYANTVIIATDDPLLESFTMLHNEKALHLVSMDQVGEMAFARHACNLATDWLRINVLSWRVRCYSMTCRSGDIACTFTNPRNEGA